MVCPSITVTKRDLVSHHNAALQRPGDNCIVRQVVDERYADSGPLEALVELRPGAQIKASLLVTRSFSLASTAQLHFCKQPEILSRKLISGCSTFHLEV